MDPRGAKFILLPRYTVATMQPLYAVRAFDYVVLTIGYVCLMSKKKQHWIPPQGGGVFVPTTDKSADGYFSFPNRYQHRNSLVLGPCEFAVSSQ